MTENRLLVARLVEGDEAAWQEYMRMPGRIILAVGRRLGLDQTTREEVFQDTCVQVHRSIHTLRDPERLFSWTYSIAYRTAIGWIKRRRPETVAVDAEGESILERIPAAEPSPAALMEQLEDARFVRAALADLGQKCRQLLTALYLAEPRPSYREISLRFKIPLGGIGPTKARCLQKLKRALKAVSKGGGASTMGAERGPRKATRHGADSGRDR